MHNFDTSSGLLSPARQCPSPNCDQRPVGSEVSLLVVHGISLPPAQFGGVYIDQLFCNQLAADEHSYFGEIAHLRVSAHLLIRRDGELVQYVPLHMRAWHAGQSTYQGRSRCNDFSIGVELEGTDDSGYEEAQYRQLAAVYRTLAQAFPALTAERIAGHSDISPGRKTDPGSSFDWSHLRRHLTQKL